MILNYIKVEKFLIFLIFVFILFNFFNTNLRLEKHDEDWTYDNIISYHVEGKTIIEIFSTDLNKRIFNLNFFSSNNYIKLNYFFLNIYDYIFSLFQNIYNIDYKKLIDISDFKDFDYPVPINTNISEFKFGKNLFNFKSEDFNFFKHYNILYFNNIIIFSFIFTITIIFYKKYNFSNYYPLLIYFLTPQINSHIIFINSDFLAIIFAPLIYLFLVNKKYIYLIIILFTLHLTNRSTFFISFAIIFFIFFSNINFKRYKYIYIILLFFLIFIVSFLFYRYFLFDFFIGNNFNFVKKSSVAYLLNGEYFNLIVDLIKSCLLFLCSILYLDGQNSFIAAYYDYFIFGLFILVFSILIFSKKIDYAINLIYLIFPAFLIVFFTNGFDHYRHHPLIYISLLYILFQTKNLDIFKKLYLLRSLFLIFLIYVNIKVLYFQYYIYH